MPSFIDTGPMTSASLILMGDNLKWNMNFLDGKNGLILLSKSFYDFFNAVLLINEGLNHVSRTDNRRAPAPLISDNLLFPND